MNIDNSESIINRLGGPTHVANLCSKEVTPQAVSQWKRTGIPAGWANYLKLLKPEAFEEELTPPSETKVA